jgi:hypothetical protein
MNLRVRTCATRGGDKTSETQACPGQADSRRRLHSAVWLACVLTFTSNEVWQGPGAAAVAAVARAVARGRVCEVRSC